MPDACFAPPIMGADVKAFEDAAPFYSKREWRHGIKSRLADNYAQISPEWLLVIYEAKPERLGFRRGDLGQIRGEGGGDHMVYWLQDSFFWLKTKIEITDRIERVYNSLWDPPTKETFDRQCAYQQEIGLPQRDFERALKMGLEAEEKILGVLREQTGFGLWPLNQETIRVARHMPPQNARVT